jgi:hypothetical protein
MKTRLWIALVAVSFFGACTWVDGACWLRSDEGGGTGQGGGSVIPGGGSYGDEPGPKPEDANPPPPPECLQVPQGACYQQCLKSYEDAAAECGKIADDSQRTACQTAAYKVYFACRESCQKQENDCLEHCKDLCYQIMDKCKEDCKDDPIPRECRGRCTTAYGECSKECDKKCK